MCALADHRVRYLPCHQSLVFDRSTFFSFFFLFFFVSLIILKIVSLTPITFSFIRLFILQLISNIPTYSPDLIIGYLLPQYTYIGRSEYTYNKYIKDFVMNYSKNRKI